MRYVSVGIDQCDSENARPVPPTVIEFLKSSRTASASESWYVRKRIWRFGVLVVFIF